MLKTRLDRNKSRKNHLELTLEQSRIPATGRF